MKYDGMTCDEWPHKKYFGSFVILLELIESAYKS